MKLSETFSIGDIFQENQDGEYPIKQFNRILKIVDNEYLYLEKVIINLENKNVLGHCTYVIDSKIVNLNEIIGVLGNKIEKIPDIITKKDITIYTDKATIESIIEDDETKSLFTEIAINKEQFSDEIEPYEIIIQDFEQKYVFNWEEQKYYPYFELSNNDDSEEPF